MYQGALERFIHGHERGKRGLIPIVWQRDLGIPGAMMSKGKRKMREEEKKRMAKRQIKLSMEKRSKRKMELL